MLAFLICEKGGPIKKTKICEILWPDTCIENALNSLSKLYQFILKNYSVIPLFSKNGSIYLNMEQIDSDLIHFCELYKRTDIESLKEAAELYKGHILQEECYEWTIQNSAYYEIKMEEILNKLISYYIQKKDRKLVSYYKEKRIMLDME